MSKLRTFGGAAFRRAASSGSTSAITDERLARTLGLYAGMVDRVLDQPERWLSVQTEATSAPARAWGFLRHTVSGDVHPGSPGWAEQPLAERTGWWLRRISVTAGTAAAAPRFAGVLADRIPLQAALGASASGLAVCAVARENGVSDPKDWVPLLAQVIFERPLAAATVTVPDVQTSQEALDAAPEGPDETPGAAHRLGAGGKRAVRGMWRLARTLVELQGVFDERPHGGLLARAVARLPVVGVAGGWLDERGAVQAAARETQLILDKPSA